MLNSSIARPASWRRCWPSCSLALGGVGALWWRQGRDRRFVALQRATADTAEERVPLFGGRPIAVEFQPPDQIRPAQMGLLLDERADTLDVTATIVDLAVRGYLTITELPKPHWFSQARLAARPAQADRRRSARLRAHRARRPVSTADDDEALRPEEQVLRRPGTGEEGAVPRRRRAQWFPANPNTVRTVCAARRAGLAVARRGRSRSGSARRWGAGLARPAGGRRRRWCWRSLSGAMPRRTAAGRDVLRRTLGFARYIKTAEVGQQDVRRTRQHLHGVPAVRRSSFKCVDRWARAFKDIDLQAATAGWYAGTSRIQRGALLLGA